MAESKGSGKIIGIIVGAVVVVAAIVVTCVLVLGGGGIKTNQDLRAAIQDRKPINCVVTNTETKQEFTIQATDGFEKLKFFSNEYEGSDNIMYVLAIKDDALYMWDDSGDMAMKMPFDSSFVDDIVSEAKNEDNSEDENVTVKCQSVSKADFSVPKGVEFTDLSNLYGGEDYDFDDHDHSHDLSGDDEDL